MEQHKQCGKCGETKPLTAFFRFKRSKDGHGSRCKSCDAAYGKQWAAKNSERVAESKRKYASSPRGKANGREKMVRYRAKRDAAADAFQRKLKKYGLTESVFWEMLAAQNGVCAICKTSEWGRGASHPFIDHDHRCCSGDRSSCGNCVRGLLCMQCNAGLGLLKDDVDVMSSALDYLKRTTEANG